MAVSEDGLVEAIYHPKMKFMWAVQWHPEYMLENENASKKIFKAFIDSIKA
jgi:putative glutamine amidotransferase